MRYHKLLPSSLSTASHDDMSVRVGRSGGEQVVYVSKDVADALRRLAIRNAEEFASLLMSFPSAIADEIGWQVKEVEEVRPLVLQALSAIVPPDLLNCTPRKRVFGAVRPPKSSS